VPKRMKSKTSPKKNPVGRGKSGGGLAKLDAEHSGKILSLQPQLLDAVHNILKDHGVNAVVHRISFRPAGVSDVDDWPCGSQPCCFVNGVWTCR
jgi:hypothetical protein